MSITSPYTSSWQLVDGAVADRGPVRSPRSRAATAARAPATLPLPGHPVEDLQPVGAAGDRPQQPLPPVGRLLGVAGLHQRLQGERRVAQPAVPVVPVARAAQLLRQRGRRGRDDAAGRRVGQRLEGEQRAHDGFAVRTVVGALVGPGLPEPLGLVQRLQRVDRGRPGLVRRVPGEHEGLALAGLDGEVGVATRSPARGGRTSEASHTASGPATAASMPSRWRTHGMTSPVAEPQPQLAAHRDPARDALDDADDVGRLVALRHEVDDPDGAVRRLPTPSPAPSCRRGNDGSSRCRRRAAPSASGRCPRCRAAPRSTASESNRGKHSQSIDPSRPTRPAASRSEMSA